MWLSLLWLIIYSILMNSNLNNHGEGLLGLVNYNKHCVETLVPDLSHKPFYNFRTTQARAVYKMQIDPSFRARLYRMIYWLISGPLTWLQLARLELFMGWKSWLLNGLLLLFNISDAIFMMSDVDGLESFFGALFIQIWQRLAGRDYVSFINSVEQSFSVEN